MIDMGVSINGGIQTLAGGTPMTKRKPSNGDCMGFHANSPGDCDSLLLRYGPLPVKSGKSGKQMAEFHSIAHKKRAVCTTTHGGITMSSF